MRITRARLDGFALPFRAPLPTAHGTLREQRGLLVRLFADDGSVGSGECTPLAGFATGSLAECRVALESTLGQLPGTDPVERLRRAGTGHGEGLASPAAARAALDVALHDLVARSQGSPVCERLSAGSGTRAPLRVSALLAGESADAVAHSAQRARDDGFETAKLKLGACGWERDLERVAAAREALGSGRALRLDANGAWGETECAAHLERLASFDIELVEQPVAAGDLPALARVRSASPIPIAADEAICGEADACDVLGAGAADLLILKLPACGGLTAAARIAARARDAGVECVVTSALDSSLGIAAAAQLAAAVGAETRAHGLATALLLADDLTSPLVPVSGRLPLPTAKGEPGLGLAPDDARLARLADTESARSEWRA